MVASKSEKKALLRFKKDIKDPSNRLASWTGSGDCCTWSGIVCNNFTGHVLELHLGNKPLKDEATLPEYEAYKRRTLSGKINPSLLDLKYLTYLDLSHNNFEDIQIPTFLGSMRRLKYLNLFEAGFVGMIPHQLGNLSNLQYLAVGSIFPLGLYVENFFWFSGLSLLKHLELKGVDLSSVPAWLLVTNELPSLQVLQLTSCFLLYLPPLPRANFSSLAVLSLSYSGFRNTLIPSWVFDLKHLVFLDLSKNHQLQGSIPDGLQNLTSLKYLDLSGNKFNSSIPQWLYRFSHLEFLSLRRNRLEGTISDDLGNLTSIQSLDLSSNRLEGRISRAWGRLCNLKSIRLSDVKLSQNITQVLDIFSSGCISDGLELWDMMNTTLSGPLTNQLLQFKNLKTLRLSYNNISGPFPSCIGELSSLRLLYLSDNKLSGTVSQIHFANLTRLLHFSISGNPIALKISPDWVPPFQLKVLDMRSCQLIGSHFPLWLLSQKILHYLDISNAGILDSVPSGFWKSLPQFHYVNLSHNQLHGKIPDIIDVRFQVFDLSSNNLSGPLPRISSSPMNGLDLSNNALSGSIINFLCHGMNETRKLRILHLSNNFLSGELPDCWMNLPYLSMLSLDNNQFTGNFPTSMGDLINLESLHVRKNSFFGTINPSLQNCTYLVQLDVAENEFVGNFPTWIDERFSTMKILILRSNKFHGLLPKELCRVASLQVLDLADNNLFGIIPRCIGNFSAMVTIDYSAGNEMGYLLPFSSEDETLVMKGRAFEYARTLNLVRSIDLSKNNFSGEIPTEMTNLIALQSLNLSYNHLVGRIPKNIGVMRSLESIDFSRNQFSGQIPQSISNLTFLSHLNLSDNNLTGKIPSGSQIQGFDASFFSGNQLCGPPLSKTCTVAVPTPDYRNGGNEDEVNWFYVSMALGFMVGFWSVISSLLISRRWRFMYFNFVDNLTYKFGCVVRKCSQLF